MRLILLSFGCGGGGGGGGGTWVVQWCWKVVEVLVAGGIGSYILPCRGPPCITAWGQY